MLAPWQRRQAELQLLIFLPPLRLLRWRRVQRLNTDGVIQRHGFPLRRFSEVVGDRVSGDSQQPGLRRRLVPVVPVKGFQRFLEDNGGQVFGLIPVAYSIVYIAKNVSHVLLIQRGKAAYSRSVPGNVAVCHALFSIQYSAVTL